MAVVVEAADREEFERWCHVENVEVTYVADVTDRGRMRMYNGDELVADISREFIDSAGAKHVTKACIAAVEDKDPFRREPAGGKLSESSSACSPSPTWPRRRGSWRCSTPPWAARQC